MRLRKSSTASRSASLGETPCEAASSRSRLTELDSGSMPVYEYRCEQCQERFEEYLSTSTKPAPPCPKCGAAVPTRLYSSISTEWLPSDVAWDRVGRSWD
jgi:putative FmdB family regulatory protein